jgi:hypothetical protein
MTASQLEAIRARARHASDGPWSVRRIPNSFPSQAGDRHTHPCVRGFRVPRRIYDLAWQQVEADAEFIASARVDVPALVDEIDTLRAALKECQRAIGELVERGDSASTEELARIAEYLAVEDSDWDKGVDKFARGRRLYMSQPQLPPRGTATILELPTGSSRRLRSQVEAGSETWTGTDPTPQS